MRRAVALALAALLSTASSASATHWNIDRAKSSLGFTVQWSGEPFVATFKSWKADIDFDPADLAHSRVSAVVDLASESSDTPDNDEGLKGPQGFSVAQFPSAHFDTTSFTKANGNNYIAVGKLSLHGATRTITLPFTLELTGTSAHVKGKAQVLRTDFGLASGEWAGDTPIAHAVTITLDLVANKQGQ
jgi:polyisoprenoid-binding protein YceI